MTTVVISLVHVQVADSEHATVSCYSGAHIAASLMTEYRQPANTAQNTVRVMSDSNSEGLVNMVCLSGKCPASVGLVLTIAICTENAIG